MVYAHLFALSLAFHVRHVVALCDLDSPPCMARLQFQALAHDNRNGDCLTEPPFVNPW